MKVIFIIKKILPTYIKFLFVKFLMLFGYAKEYNDIWLISERGTDARDNGYFFYKFLTEHHRDLKVYYVIDYNSADFNKVNRNGKTIRHKSLKHYAAVFRSKYLISSHIMGFTPEPEAFLILKNRNFINFRGKQIFLQHGITKGNIEGLKYPNVKVDLFICGAFTEYEYIKNTYNHPDGVVRFTGLARYDTLNNNVTKRQILIMPTWRKWLNSLNEEDFKKSDYYNNWVNLLSNEKIYNWLKTNDFKIMFYPHYEMQKFINSFSPLANDYIKICSFCNSDVQTLLNESKLLITDYSSVYFDFAYLNKPIIFYQFDRDDFFNMHYNKGYFNENDFGRIVKSVNEVIKNFYRYDGEFFENPYESKQKEFFGNLGTGCCERIYSAISDIKND